MPDTAADSTLIEPYRRRAIAALTPILAAGTDDDAAAAIADEMLSSYHPTSPRQVQFAAQVIALGWAALTCLRAAADVANLTLEERMRLHDDAIALEAMSRKVDPAKPGCSEKWDEAGFQAVMRAALEVLRRANHRTGMPAPVRPQPIILQSGMMTEGVMTGGMMTESLLSSRHDRQIRPPKGRKPH